ncbi:MAG: twin-arginine translocase TatA/TatE family subunit [Alistipes sp.]|nr:twin-arginine translocase TatA/TatE family subunit [Alistipes sp.]
MLNVMPLLFGNFGWSEILIIVLLVLIFFGGKKIPELMRGMGRGVKEFKDAVNKDYSAEEAPKKEESGDNGTSAE